MNKLFCLAVLSTVCAISSARNGFRMPKPGICPVNGKTMRVLCRSEYDCPGIERCCRHGYGKYGKQFFCTVSEKPGTCPFPGGGPCVEECSNDFDCLYGSKCCFNGCGHVCTHPEYEKVYY